MAIRIRRYCAEHIVQYGRSRATIDATGRRNRVVIDFGVKKLVVALWKSLPEASVRKARNEPSTQLIEATSCVERSNAMIKTKVLS